MDRKTVDLILSRYGYSTDALIERAGLTADGYSFDAEKVVKLAKHLAAKHDIANTRRVNPLVSSKVIGTYLGPSLVLGELLTGDRPYNVPFRVFDLLCSCGAVFQLPVYKLTSHRRCPECTGWDQLLTGEYAATGRKHHKPAKSTGVRKYALVYERPDPDDKRKCIVRCDCGKTKSVYRSAFSAGTIKSCGCGIHKSLESQP